jgi:hypothetical protein
MFVGFGGWLFLVREEEVGFFLLGVDDTLVVGGYKRLGEGDVWKCLREWREDVGRRGTGVV